jgi:rSAM/selenodomain-associated transferase 1
VRLTAQGGGDIGARMHRALLRGLATHEAVILIGSDVPSLRARDLRAAARALRGGADAVFSPAEDGGYALIGVARISTLVFRHVEWGSPSVMAQTRRRMRALGWRWSELRTVWDVDRPQDHARLLRRGLLGRAP